MTARHKSLEELARLRDTLAEQARERAEAEKRRRAAIALEEKRRNEFRDAMKHMGEVQPLARRDRVDHEREPHPPDPRSRARDEREALHASLSDEIDVDSLLDTDGELSFCRPGIGPDVIRKLRRGEWSIQAALDLHGHRVEEAREETAQFLREAVKRGLRCVRIVHGKGLGRKTACRCCATRCGAGWCSARTSSLSARRGLRKGAPAPSWCCCGRRDKRAFPHGSRLREGPSLHPGRDTGCLVC